MVQKIKNHTDLECDMEYLRKGILNAQFGENDTKIPWGCGKWTHATGILNFLGGQKARTPGKYFQDHPERKTYEYVHKSVKERIKYHDYQGPDISGLPEDESDDDIEMELRW
jgi:hypothetical protein